MPESQGFLIFCFRTPLPYPPGPGTGTRIAGIIRKLYFYLEGFEADDLPDFSQGF
jgi:hypothetical protein